MKKLGIILLMSTFAFSAITFNKTMIYKDISGNAEVENGFGLDFDGIYRSLNYIAVLELPDGKELE